MNDVFLSYAAPDRAVAQKFADVLEALGWSVWWDREIPLGKPFDQVIEEELNAARCVIVLWTHDSVRSRWVKTEAGAAAERDRLLPVLLDDVQIPLEFRRVQTAMLHGWDGDTEHPEFRLLLDSLRQIVGTPTAEAGSTAKVSRKKAPIFGWRAKASAAAAVLVLALILLFQARSTDPDAASSKDVRATGQDAVGATAARPSEQNAAPSGAARTGATQPSERARGPALEARAPDTQSTPRTRETVAAAGGAQPTKGPYRVRIGDTISDGVPAPGAGHIESPGVRDTYTFEAKSGERVYFRMFEYGKGMESIEWKVNDPDGAQLFETRLAYGEPGARVLAKAGTYTMTIGSDRVPGVGTYRIKLFPVPAPQRFTYRVGDMISENAPAAGAGAIETPGAKDIYGFTAAPGQRIYFRMFEYAKGMEQIEWKLIDSDEGVVFDRRLAYGDPGVQALKKGGAYTMTVGSDRNAATGTYRIQLTSAD
jgi:hypothetical protein